MTNNQDQINQLLDKLETLLKRQELFSKEVNELKQEIIQLKTSEIKNDSEQEEFTEEDAIKSNHHKLEGKLRKKNPLKNNPHTIKVRLLKNYAEMVIEKF